MHKLLDNVWEKGKCSVQDDRRKELFRLWSDKMPLRKQDLLKQVDFIGFSKINIWINFSDSKKVNIFWWTYTHFNN